VGDVDLLGKFVLDPDVDLEFVVEDDGDLDELVLLVGLLVALFVLDEDVDLEDVGQAEGVLEIVAERVEERVLVIDLVTLALVLLVRVVVELLELLTLLVDDLDCDALFVVIELEDGDLEINDDLVELDDIRGDKVGTADFVDVLVLVGVRVSKVATVAKLRSYKDKFLCISNGT
jgi:hypothetical protein